MLPGLSFASTDASEYSDSKESLHKIKNIKEFENQLKYADTSGEISNVIKQADCDTVKDYYAELVDENIEITNNITGALSDLETQDDAEDLADELRKEYRNIKDVDCFMNSIGDKTIITYDIKLEQGNIRLTIEDGLEDEDAAESLATTSSALRDMVIKVKKKYGDRYTSINNECAYKGYPKSYFKFRIGYTLHKSKKISGRYIKSYKHEAGQAYLARVTTEPIDGSMGWDKKAANEKNIKAHCSYIQRLYLSGKEVLTYKVSISYKVVPSKWDSEGAVITATGQVTKYKLA